MICLFFLMYLISLNSKDKWDMIRLQIHHKHSMFFYLLYNLAPNIERNLANTFHSESFNRLVEKY